MVRRFTSHLLECLNVSFSFYQTQSEQLVALQAKHWDPLHDWIRKAYGVELNKPDSFVCSTQPEKTKQKMSQILEELDQWELAGGYRVYLLLS